MVSTAEEIDTWFYLVDLTPNAVGVGLSSILFVLQAILGFYYRQWWIMGFWCLSLGMNIAGYALRIGANIGWAADNDNCWAVQYAFFIITPALFMAGIYYQMSKLLTINGLHFAKFRPMFYTGLFSGFDLLSILVQAAGGGLASSSDPNTGRWIVMAGIIIQVLSMLVFFWLFTSFNLNVARAHEDDKDPAWAHIRAKPLFKWFTPAVYIAWVFVFTRSVYRLIELAEGWRGKLASHEVYFLVLDALMMICATVTLTIFYPGIVYGRDPIPVSGLHLQRYFVKGEDSTLSSNEQKEV